MRHTDWIDRDIAMYDSNGVRVRTDQKSIQL